MKFGDSEKSSAVPGTPTDMPGESSMLQPTLNNVSAAKDDSASVTSTRSPLWEGSASYGTTVTCPGTVAAMSTSVVHTIPTSPRGVGTGAVSGATAAVTIRSEPVLPHGLTDRTRSPVR